MTIKAIIYRLGFGQKSGLDSAHDPEVRDERQRPEPGILPIAGTPLILRQMQWLRSIGVHDIAVEVSQEKAGQRVVSLLDNDVFGRLATIVRSKEPLGPRGVAEEVAWQCPVLAVPADVIGDGDIGALLERAEDGGQVFALEPPSEDWENPAVVSIIGGEDGPNPLCSGPGWGVRVRDYEEARNLGHALLMGQLPPRDEIHRWPLIVHGHEREPGIWMARGAKVARKATLQAPVFVGPGAVIGRGARVGPDAFLAERAVVSAGAQVRACFISAGTLVGEGVELERAVVYPDRVHELQDVAKERRFPDGRVVAARDAFMSGTTVARLGALFSLLLIVAIAVGLIMRYAL